MPYMKLSSQMFISLLCQGIFFSLLTQEFFRGQGKIKVGTGTKKNVLPLRKCYFIGGCVMDL